MTSITKIITSKHGTTNYKWNNTCWGMQSYNYIHNYTDHYISLYSQQGTRHPCQQEPLPSPHLEREHQDLGLQAPKPLISGSRLVSRDNDEHRVLSPCAAVPTLGSPSQPWSSWSLPSPFCDCFSYWICLLTLTIIHTLKSLPPFAKNFAYISSTVWWNSPPKSIESFHSNILGIETILTKTVGGTYTYTLTIAYTTL